MGNNINLIPNDNEINLVNQDRAIIISDQDNFTQIEITQPLTSVVQILTGPMGPEGPAGKGTFPFTGSADITGSFSLIGNASFTGSIFLISGSFSGSGANLFNIPASAIVGLNLSQIATGSVTASVNTVNDIFLIRSSSVEIFKVNNEGVVVLQEKTAPPTVVAGGIFFSSSGDFFFGS
jgi:hypothetical protein